MTSFFQLSKSKDKRFKFVLKAGNAQTILTSETYETRSSAEKGISSVRANHKSKTRYEARNSRNGKFFFVLTGGNKQIIGTSEMYETERSRDKGIASVKTNGGTRIVKDAA